MAKRRKNRVPNLNNRDTLKNIEGAEFYERVRFELEEDAEALFRHAVENLSPKMIADKEKSARKVRPTGTSDRGVSSQVDLHGLTLGQAQDRVERSIEERLATTASEFSLRIVTGKGIHSGPGGGVLAREIHEFVRLRFHEVIVAMTDSPSDVTLSGVPMRGFFDVKFRPRSRRS